MLVDRQPGARGHRSDGADRWTSATKGVVKAVTPTNLDRDLPGQRVAHGFNIGLTPVLFAAIGYGIDRAVGTLPVFTVGLSILCIVGLLTRFYYTYKAAISDEEAAAAARRSRHGGPRR